MKPTSVAVVTAQYSWSFGRWHFERKACASLPNAIAGVTTYFARPLRGGGREGGREKGLAMMRGGRAASTAPSSAHASCAGRRRAGQVRHAPSHLAARAAPQRDPIATLPACSLAGLGDSRFLAVAARRLGLHGLGRLLLDLLLGVGRRHRGELGRARTEPVHATRSDYEREKKKQRQAARDAAPLIVERALKVRALFAKFVEERMAKNAT